MQSLNDLLITRFVEKNDKSKIVNERQAAIKLFCDNIPDMTAKRIAMKVSFMSVSELYDFHKQCLRAKHYGKFFNYSLNPKNAR
jgi:hypothetical protein